MEAAGYGPVPGPSKEVRISLLFIPNGVIDFTILKYSYQLFMRVIEAAFFAIVLCYQRRRNCMPILRLRNASSRSPGDTMGVSLGK